MKICCISDTHGQEIPWRLMPEADVLVHAGDLTSNGTMAQFVAAAKWLNSLRDIYAEIVCIAGNHDFVAEAFMKENYEAEMREKIFRKVHYLRDSGVRIGGKFFYGSPWTPRFFDWAFNADRGPAIDKYWDWIPLYTNVLISHGPPMGILDRVGNEHVGCANLRQRVERLSLGANIFGHIHCGAGTKTLAGTQYVNAAVLDERYRFANAPVVIEI